MKQATLIAGLIFLVIGAFIWATYSKDDKIFSLAGNFIATGGAFVLISLLIKAK